MAQEQPRASIDPRFPSRRERSTFSQSDIARATSTAPEEANNRSVQAMSRALAQRIAVQNEQDDRIEAMKLTSEYTIALREAEEEVKRSAPRNGKGIEDVFADRTKELREDFMTRATSDRVRKLLETSTLSPSTQAAGRIISHREVLRRGALQIDLAESVSGFSVEAGSLDNPEDVNDLLLRLHDFMDPFVDPEEAALEREQKREAGEFQSIRPADIPGFSKTIDLEEIDITANDLVYDPDIMNDEFTKARQDVLKAYAVGLLQRNPKALIQLTEKNAAFFDGVLSGEQVQSLRTRAIKSLETTNQAAKTRIRGQIESHFRQLANGQAPNDPIEFSEFDSDPEVVELLVDSYVKEASAIIQVQEMAEDIPTHPFAHQTVDASIYDEGFDGDTEDLSDTTQSEELALLKEKLLKDPAKNDPTGKIFEAVRRYENTLAANQAAFMADPVKGVMGIPMFQRALNDPSLDPEARTSLIAVLQARMGLREDQIKFIPGGMEDHLTDKLLNLDKAEDVRKVFVTMKAQYGKHYPQVMKQLFNKEGDKITQGYFVASTLSDDPEMFNVAMNAVRLTEKQISTLIQSKEGTGGSFKTASGFGPLSDAATVEIAGSEEYQSFRTAIIIGSSVGSTEQLADLEKMLVKMSVIHSVKDQKTGLSAGKDISAATLDVLDKVIFSKHTPIEDDGGFFDAARPDHVMIPNKLHPNPSLLSKNVIRFLDKPDRVTGLDFIADSQDPNKGIGASKQQIAESIARGNRHIRLDESLTGFNVYVFNRLTQQWIPLTNKSGRNTIVTFDEVFK